MHFWYKKSNLPEKKQEIFGDPLFPTASFDPGLNLEPLRECYVLVENCNDEAEDMTIQALASMMSRFVWWAQEDMNLKKCWRNYRYHVHTHLP